MSIKLISTVMGIFLLWSVLLTASAPEEKGKIFPYSYQEKVLKNGLGVIIVPMESSGLVSYYTIARTGSRDEYEPGHSGFAHFFEHMMFRGTKKYPGSLYDKLITEMGADANAYTSNDLTCFYLNFTSRDLEKIMELESDRFQNLWYTEQAFKTEAGTVHGEYLKDLSSPFFALEEKLMDTAFKNHTYKHTTMGFRRDIEAMPTMYKYSKSFFQRYYRPENIVLFIVGDIDPVSTFNLVGKYYGNWGKGYVPPEIPVEPEQKGKRRAEVKFNGKTLPILTIAYKAPAFDPESIGMAACYLMGDLIFGETSDLYKKLVLDEQRVQFISADFSASRDPGLFTIYTMIKKENDIHPIEKEIYSAVKYFQTHKVGKKKLEDIKSNFKYSFLMGLNTPSHVADNLARIIAMTGDIKAVDQLYTSLEKVTPENILNAANEFLIKDKRTIVILKGREK